jgi:fido (protein-threonine AMPylation protein)
VARILNATNNLHDIEDVKKKEEFLLKIYYTIIFNHPFIDFNGRTTRIFIEELANVNGLHLDFDVLKNNFSTVKYNKNYENIATLANNLANEMLANNTFELSD